MVIPNFGAEGAHIYSLIQIPSFVACRHLLMVTVCDLFLSLAVMTMGLAGHAHRFIFSFTF